MYKSKTVYIIGAGASFEIGMPTGEGLKDIIKEKLNFKFDDFGRRQNSGSRNIYDALQEYSNPNSSRETNAEFNEHIRACLHVRDAMNQALSIDNFVDNLNDERVTRVSKLAIGHF